MQAPFMREKKPVYTLFLFAFIYFFFKRKRGAIIEINLQTRQPKEMLAGTESTNLILSCLINSSKHVTAQLPPNAKRNVI